MIYLYHNLIQLLQLKNGQAEVYHIPVDSENDFKAVPKSRVSIQIYIKKYFWSFNKEKLRLSGVFITVRIEHNLSEEGKETVTGGNHG